jgi:hypothetical protein
MGLLNQYGKTFSLSVRTTLADRRLLTNIKASGYVQGTSRADLLRRIEAWINGNNSTEPFTFISLSEDPELKQLVVTTGRKTL